ncbi:MAG: nucleoside phosphorylase [Anaerolineae bacterium]|nr:nucleoside phosphorylase [Anaerolineae bacterium]
MFLSGAFLFQQQKFPNGGGTNLNDFLPVTKIPRSGLPEFALVCGDPRRAARIATLFENSREIGSNREYVTYRGTWQGVDLVVSSHGVGGPGAICMFEELAMAGVKTIIRVGTCGGLQPNIEDGDLVIATGTIREDGVTDQFVPLPYPAFSTPEVVLALQHAARQIAHPWHRGVVWTKALFYPGVIPPTDVYLKAGIVAVEMELAALLIMASVRGLNAGGILVSDGNPAKEQKEYNPHRTVVEDGVGKCIEVALGAIKHLAQSSAS